MGIHPHSAIMLLLKLRKYVEMDVPSFYKSNSILLCPKMSTFRLFEKTAFWELLLKEEKLQEL